MNIMTKAFLIHPVYTKHYTIQTKLQIQGESQTFSHFVHATKE